MAISTLNRARPLPDIVRLRAMLSYDPKSGRFSWLESRRGHVRTDRSPGHVGPNGYVYVGLDGQHWLGHRLAWKLHFGEDPPPVVDHINGDRSDNRISNLRAATVMQNGANRRRDVRNNTGAPGVSLCRQTGKYRASLRVDGRLIDLGRHGTVEAARARRLAAEMEHFGAFQPMEA